MLKNRNGRSWESTRRGGSSRRGPAHPAIPGRVVFVGRTAETPERADPIAELEWRQVVRAAERRAAEF